MNCSCFIWWYDSNLVYCLNWLATESRLDNSQFELHYVYQSSAQPDMGVTTSNSQPALDSRMCSSQPECSVSASYSKCW